MSSTSILLFTLAAVGPALLISWVMGFVVRRFASRMGLLDHPSARKVHASAIPLGGGVAIWAGVMGSFLLGQISLLLIDGGVIPQSLIPEFAVPHLKGLGARLPALWAILGLGTALMVLGLFDDRWGLDWRLRLLVEFLVGGLVLFVHQVL
jgi:UDP-GlcNAc:undecaprenyl-phosphate GlcNAc-1-phosphate transferase